VKKPLFLLFVCLISLTTIKRAKTRSSLERIDVEFSHTMTFDGVLYLPKMIHFEVGTVKKKGVGLITLTVGENTFTYYRKYEFGTNTYWLESKSHLIEEVEVEVGDVISTDFSASHLDSPKIVKLFIRRAF